jgi:phospholipid/cholesterol/gamma-HCH transport system substrate-binding protein
MPTAPPRWIQAKLIQSFENYDIAHAPLRSMDGVDADYRLLIDLRGFQVTGNSDPDPAVAPQRATASGLVSTIPRA